MRRLLLLATAISCVLADDQVPFTSLKPRKLHGRFIQITDIHPDPYYTAGSSKQKSCHRGKPKKKKNRAPLYGAEYSDCDSPTVLSNYTLNFLDQKWAKDIDFVVWTGDNARHDNDRKLPRTPSEIYELNRSVVRKMKQIFTSKGIPVIPSLGNNDVYPHNIMIEGPNSITNEFSSIWQDFIPFPHRQVFQRGAYYSVEVIPNALAVVALNTMYWYDANKAVGGCNFKDPEDPGNLQFDWLEVQLKLMRERNMHVWLSGHVPPSSGNFYPECYVRYVELSLRFQDTVLGHLYGHMNADHFFLLESIDLLLNEPAKSRGNDNLCDALLTDFGQLPKGKNTNYDNYAVINVSPPVVPNPYVPTFRVFAYNISGAEEALKKKGKKKKKDPKRRHRHNRGEHGNKESQCKEEPYRDSWKCHLNESWYSDPEAPSRTNTLWSGLGYAQYYIPDLKSGNETHKPDFKLEYTTFRPSALRIGQESDEEPPIPLRHLPKSLKEGSKTKKYAPYKMKDLTIRSWVDLAHRLGDNGSESLRDRFCSFVYLSG